ncbi:Mobile element protein [Methanosarcina lacustris Z-7289]|uniref:Mobile element protein n=1 Tax=Methanosarcina lacustris Z-7289 TaxID=1434111 RepID=A0A0E3S834_9EURY|nr:Mobile element protein [Methanosarcina lacustris Z-7289]
MFCDDSVENDEKPVIIHICKVKIDINQLISDRLNNYFRKLSLIHEKIANQRHDFQHKVSNRLISENQAIAVETLNIKGMKKNHKLAQVVSDSAWYSFVLKLTYKLNG